MIRTVPLVTDRLVLRRFVRDDAVKAYDNWMSDPEVTHFLTWNPHRSPRESLDTIDSWISEYQYGSMDWCITSRDSGEPIGSITAVRDHPNEGWCELGYCLGTDHWDRGYMTEALKAVVSYILIDVGYLFVQARHETENEASGRVLEKAGFSDCGKRILSNPKTGRPTEYKIMRRYRRSHQTDELELGHVVRTVLYVLMHHDEAEHLSRVPATDDGGILGYRSPAQLFGCKCGILAFDTVGIRIQRIEMLLRLEEGLDVG